ncbi:M12 family metallo-peptidase [Ideonella sp. DXS29W]|uniref:M12 family metallo-peptidase n=1 Tax=Ideonella lacteola TaxID=2984193 RepID=A0ABU9BPK4_9BURK
MSESSFMALIRRAQRTLFNRPARGRRPTVALCLAACGWAASMPIAHAQALGPNGPASAAPSRANVGVANTTQLFALDLAGSARDAVQSRRIKELRRQPTTQSLTLVRLRGSTSGAQTLGLVLTRDRSVVVQSSRIELREGADHVWIGQVSGQEGQAILVVRDGQITGSVRDGTDLYRIEPLGQDLHAIVKINPAGFPPEHPASFKGIERRAASEPLPSLAPSPDMLAPEATQQIDVLVAYTPSARASVADIKATIDLAVAESNQSYLNSGVNIQLRLVDSFELNYSESGKSYNTILNDFMANATVQARRNSSGADMSAMIINQSDYCGMAAAIMAQASNAYAVVHYSCATGYYSFAHELGHLQGARHDPANDPTNTPFAYGHGYQQNSGSTWRTIMAYNCPSNCPRLQYWSNPNVLYQGLPMGTSTVSHNARVLNETAATVAAFRSAAQPDYVYCASEGQTCSFSGTRMVAYGSGSTLFYRRLTGGTACNNAVFGDPTPGVAKTCYVGADVYSQCSSENQTCSFTGTRSVAYGANGSFAYGTFTNGVACNNATFGDPAPNVAKACYTGPTAYVYCSGETQNCALPGVRSVAYGANGRFSYRTLSGTFACNNATFGDPAPNIGKACYVGPDAYSYCASEGGSCALSGTRNVAYGANGSFVYKTLSGTVACNNATFGDPTPNVGKACYVQ